MAKKEKEDKNAKTTKDYTWKDIVSKFGDVISTGRRVFERQSNLKVLSVSPSLDMGLGGGLLEGSVIMVSGLPKVGKTSTCLQVCANAQKEGRKVVYVDGEARLRSCNLGGIEGLDLDKMDIIHSPPDAPPLSAEDFLSILENVLKRPEYAGCVAVIDSTSSLVPRAELDQEVSGNIRANLPKMLAHWLKKNSQTISNQRCIVLCITHYVTNTSGYGKTKLADSGLYLQYACNSRLDVKSVEDWLEGENKVGLKITWDISCSSLGGHKSSSVSCFRFNKGLDAEAEILDIGISLGLIEKGGSWYTASFMEEYDENYDEKNYKQQGLANMYNYIVEHKDIYNKLEQRVKELLK